MRFRREVLGALSAVFVVACSAAASGPGATVALPAATPSPVVEGVGTLPADLPSVTAPPGDATSTSTTGPTESTEPGPTTEPAKSFLANGNRILLIGDSVLASTARRYSNDMCKQMVPLGWDVAVEAEVNRQIDFGQKVWAARGEDGWDVVVVFLGTNYGGDEQDYLRRLNNLINDVGDAQVVLITVTEFEPEVLEVNVTLRALVDVYDNVSVLEWGEISADSPEVLNPDGIHLSPAGRAALAAAVALHVGRAPDPGTDPGTDPETGAVGECLQSRFTDDSAGSVNGGRPSTPTRPRTTNPSTTLPPTGGAPTTTRPIAPTTTIGGSAATTAPPVVSPTTVSPTTVATAPVTVPPTVAPPTTPPPPPAGP